MTDVTTLLLSAASDHSDPGALERAERALESRRLKPGDYFWMGYDCLRVVAVDEHNSTHTRQAATVSAIMLDQHGNKWWLWNCPECHRTVSHTGEEIPLRHDPRCPECACPPTQRDPGLPPARPGLSDGGVGGADPERSDDG